MSAGEIIPSDRPLSVRSPHGGSLAMTVRPIARDPAVHPVRHAVGCALVVLGVCLVIAGVVVVRVSPVGIAGLIVAAIGYGLSRRWRRVRPAPTADLAARRAASTRRAA